MSPSTQVICKNIKHLGVLVLLFVSAIGCSKRDATVASQNSSFIKNQDSTQEKANDKIFASNSEAQMAREILRQLEVSHQIFREVWLQLINKSKLTPMSVNSSEFQSPFSELRERLMPFVDYEKGFKANLLSIDSECRLSKEPRLLIKKVKLLESEKTESDKKMEQSEGVQLTKTKIQLYSSQCEYKDKPFWAVAAFEVRPHDVWITFNPKEMSKSFGASLSLVGKPARCQILFNEKQKLNFLNCSGLGHGVDAVTHYLFTRFEYKRNQQQMLIAQADKYQNNLKTCDDSQSCVSIQVPLSGKIRITENLIKSDSREKYERELKKINEEQKRLNLIAEQQKAGEGQVRASGKPRMQAPRQVVEGANKQNLKIRNGQNKKQGNNNSKQTGRLDPNPIDDPEQKSPDEIEQELREKLGLPEGTPVSEEMWKSYIEHLEMQVKGESNESEKALLMQEAAQQPIDNQNQGLRR